MNDALHRPTTNDVARLPAENRRLEPGNGTQRASSPGTGSADAIARLDALAAELAAHGWTTRLDAMSGRIPSLLARNPTPGATALSEHIYALPRTDGTWTYWWPWKQPIAEAPAVAAAIIVRVLRSTDTP